MSEKQKVIGSLSRTISEHARTSTSIHCFQLSQLSFRVTHDDSYQLIEMINELLGKISRKVSPIFFFVNSSETDVESVRE